VTNPIAIAPATTNADEYLAVSRQALRTSGGAEALDQLGYWDMLAHLDDADGRSAVFAVARAQGRELVGTAALGGLLAQPYLHGTAIAPGSVLATVPRWSKRRGMLHMIVGELDHRHVVVDRPGEGASIVPPESVSLRVNSLPGRHLIREADVDWSAARPLATEDAALIARRRSYFLGRLALAAEILGAAEAAVALAVEHAMHREQFNQPIGRFQAVRHLLAWATTDCVAIESVVLTGVALDQAAPARYDEVVKALAGRNGRKACERALQVLGGVGFTTEHDHHHHHSRVLALDALVGTSADLTHGLGKWLRDNGDPKFASGILRLDVS
jgi:Acyl-CoA dehydrogenase, C-terminal domain